jgi:hypothetical protein
LVNSVAISTVEVSSAPPVICPRAPVEGADHRVRGRRSGREVIAIQLLHGAGIEHRRQGDLGHVFVVPFENCATTSPLGPKCSCRSAVPPPTPSWLFAVLAEAWLYWVSVALPWSRKDSS